MLELMCELMGQKISADSDAEFSATEGDQAKESQIVVDVYNCCVLLLLMWKNL